MSDHFKVKPLPYAYDKLDGISQQTNTYHQHGRILDIFLDGTLQQIAQARWVAIGMGLPRQN